MVAFNFLNGSCNNKYKSHFMVLLLQKMSFFYQTPYPAACDDKALGKQKKFIKKSTLYQTKVTSTKKNIKYLN